jgi:CheY-like chemotaxis protein
MALTSVLVAEDSRVSRVLMCAALRAYGLEVLEATNGNEAVSVLLAKRPELAILDGLMPKCSGFEVISKLREVAPTYRPVIFIVTAVYKSNRMKAEAISKYGVDEYLEKPLEPEDLVKAIARHFPGFPPPGHAEVRALGPIR